MLLRARAIETGAYVLAPAQGGLHEDGRGTWGRTLGSLPGARSSARLDHDEPGVLTVDLDLAAVAKARAAIPALAKRGRASRRPERRRDPLRAVAATRAWVRGVVRRPRATTTTRRRGGWWSARSAPRAIAKQIMAPAVAGTKASGARRLPPEGVRRMMREAMGEVRRHVESTFDYVGDRFAARGAGHPRGQVGGARHLRRGLAEGGEGAEGRRRRRLSAAAGADRRQEAELAAYLAGHLASQSARACGLMWRASDRAKTSPVFRSLSVLGSTTSTLGTPLSLVRP